MAKKRAVRAGGDERGARAWAFLAVSAAPQEHMLEADQLAWARQTAEANGWALTHTVRGVASAKDGPRAVVRQLLRELRDLEPEQRPHWVLMTRIDRVSRGTISSTLVVMHDLKELGVRVWSREEGREVRIDAAQEEFLVAAKALVAAQENEVRRDKQLATYRRKRSAGMAIGNKRPYGLEIGPDGKDVAKEPEAQAVRAAFAMRADGFGFHAIGRKLQAVAPPHVFRNGRSQQVRWRPNRVSRMLSNPAYRGVVVDDVTFLRAQHVGEAHSRGNGSAGRSRHPWPLSGSIRCYCGTAMNGISGGAVGRRIRYYACRALWNHNGRVRSVGADALEVAFIGMLERLEAEPGLSEAYQRANTPANSPAMLERARRSVRDRVADLERRRRIVWNGLESGELRSRDAQERLDNLAAEHDDLKSQLAALDREQLATAARERTQRDAAQIISRAADAFRTAGLEPFEGGDDPRRAVVRAVAILVGGLLVDRADTLQIGRSEDPARQRRRRASEA